MKKNWIKNPNGGNMLHCLLYTWKFLFLKNIKISIFGGISKFRLWADFGRFWQFWAVLGSFGQFRAEIAAFTVAEILPVEGRFMLRGSITFAHFIQKK